MERATSWTTMIYIDEHEGQTRARARLTTSDTELTGLGMARCRPGETDVPEIGDELAAARALADLAHQLLELSAADLETVASRSRAVT
jgi:hypothetical protein